MTLRTNVPLPLSPTHAKYKATLSKLIGTSIECKSWNHVRVIYYCTTIVLTVTLLAGPNTFAELDAGVER